MPVREFSLHADVSEHCGGDLNDMVVDRRRIWAALSKMPSTESMMALVAEVEAVPGGLAPGLDSIGNARLLTTIVEVPGAGRP